MTASELNNQYQILREQLQYLSHSERNQLLFIQSWLAPLLKSDSVMQTKTFVRELTPIIFTLLPRVNPIGCNPEFIQSIIDLVETINQCFPKLFDEEEINSSLQILHEILTKLYCWLGVPHYQISNDTHLDESIKSESSWQIENCDNTEFQILSEWIQHLKSNEQSLSESSSNALIPNPYILNPLNVYESILTKWNEFITAQHASVNVPLLECDLTTGQIQNFRQFGIISPLRIIVHPLNDHNQKDIISFAHSLSQADANHDGSDIINVIDGVRAIAGIYINAYTPSFYSLSLEYDDKRYAYTGSSHGLAVAANLISTLSEESYDKKYFAINGGVVLTGSVEKNGNVHLLPDESIRQKVETIFYSPYSALVIPKSNEEAAAEALKTLNEKWSSRKLEIIPVRTIHDLFDRRKITTRTYLTIPQRAKKNFQHYRKSIIAVATIIPTIILLLYLLLIADFDNNPAEIKMENNYYHVFNKKGKELWKELIGTEANPFTNENLYSIKATGFLFQYYSIFDIDQDGKNEVLLTHPIVMKNYSDRLDCHNADGTIRWTQKFGKPTITNEGIYSEDVFRIFNVWAGTFDSTNTTRIVTVSCNNHYSCFVNILDSNRNILNEYYHCGPLYHLDIIETEKGNKELLLTGTHNGFMSAVAVVLDLSQVKGASPQEETHRLVSPKLATGSEKYFIRFPKSDVNLSLNNFPHPIASVLNAKDSSIIMDVRETLIPPDYHMPKDEYAHILYTFNKKMECVGVTTSTYFDHLHRNLIAHGSIHSINNAAYRKNLANHIEYWNGDRLVNYPTMNKRYLEAVKKVNAIQ